MFKVISKAAMGFSVVPALSGSETETETFVHGLNN